MTREQIYEDEFGFLAVKPSHTVKKAVFSAMDEYAKQQAIAFANYLHLNYQPEAEAGYWYDQHDPRNQNPITTEWIYNQFIEQQNK